MKTNMRFLLILLLFITTVYTPVLAQINFGDLQVNPQLFSKKKKQLKADGVEVLYVVDTLRLPFLDDFSTDRLKRYEVIDSNLIIDSVDVLFKVNGFNLDSISGLFDTTYNIIRHDFPPTIDSTAQTPLFVIFYNDDNNLNLATDTLVLWPATFTELHNNQLFVRDLRPDTVLYNIFDTLAFYPDDKSIWLDDQVWINNTFPVNPPTWGVATFDGIDADGMAYNLTYGSSGDADKLTSKPIDLGEKLANVPYTSADSIYLSFYYQTRGIGDAPELSDELALEFYDVENGTWAEVYTIVGDTLQSFKKVMVPIIDAKYLKRGFQFRFSSYASTSGSFDHFHIDYVYLNSGRTVSNDKPEDMALIKGDASSIVGYTEMPWKHYVLNNTSFTSNKLNFTIGNLSGITCNVRNTVRITDLGTNSLVYVSHPDSAANSNLAQQSVWSFRHNLQIPGNEFYYTPDASERKKFRIDYTTYTSSISNDVNKENDTVSVVQVLDTYYAYDDGGAERTISMVGTGSKIAYEFNADISNADTLRAIWMYFPPTQEDITTRAFRIYVWSELGDNETELYKGELVSYPIYSETNEYIRYELEENIVLKGKFYVGFEQIAATEIYLGFDRNNSSTSKIFFNTNDQWLNLEEEGGLAGSMMMRPDFGEPEKPPLQIEEIVKAETVRSPLIFPNPAHQSVEVNLQNLIKNEYATFGFTVELFDMTGRMLERIITTSTAHFDLVSMPVGIYMIRISGGELTAPQTHKLIVRH